MSMFVFSKEKILFFLFSHQNIRIFLKTLLASIRANYHLCKNLFRLTWEMQLLCGLASFYSIAFLLYHAI